MDGDRRAAVLRCAEFQVDREARVAARLPAADAQVLPAEGSFKEAA